MRNYIFLFLVLSFCNTNICFATNLTDEVQLKNGEMLIGEVIGQNEDGALLLQGGDVIEAHRVKELVLRLHEDKDIVTYCDMVNDDGDLNIYLKDSRQHRGRIIKKYEERVKTNRTELALGPSEIIEKYVWRLKLDTEYSGLVVVNPNDLLKGRKKEVIVSSKSKYRVKYFDVHMKDGKVFKRKIIKQNTAGDILSGKEGSLGGVRKAFYDTVIKFTEIKKILPHAKPIKDTSSFRWDVVHLKNGDSIRGHDLEVILEKPLKIQMTKDSKELVSYRFDEVKHVFTNVDGSRPSKLRRSLFWLFLVIIIAASGLDDSSDDYEGPEELEGILKMFPVNY
ncbi:MAG: hypothetical protein VX294_02560 [Candidatus Latescibacterota bacterium]|nr:hypothetical protein [Candidatus Latescibacterota bacterium]